MPTYGTAGWRGVISIGQNQNLRFISESITVDMGLELAQDVHVGQRTTGVYQFRLIQPSGSLTIPLVVESPEIDRNRTTLESVCKEVMIKAITPYNPVEPNQMNNLENLPWLGDLTVYRGDVNKFLRESYVGSVTVSGSSNDRVTADLSINSIYGEYRQPTNPPAFNKIVRVLFFNELEWEAANFTKVTYFGTNISVVPRNFSLTVNGNLIPDDSYNPDEPQAIRGYVPGRQDVSCNITIVGAANVFRGGTELTDPVEKDNNGMSIGGLYRILNGIWTSRTINVAGPAELNVSNLVLSGMGTGYFAVTPGKFLGGS